MQSLPLLTGLVLLFLLGCATATRSPGPSSSNSSEEPKSLKSVLQSDLSRRDSSGGSRMTSQGEIIVRGIKLENNQFDFPITINSKVEQWVDYFTGRGRGHFEKYLERSELFIPYIVPILRQHGLPEDFVYLALIESGFNNHARSHAKAVGPWQFISSTGRNYGLMVNWGRAP